MIKLKSKKEERDSSDSQGINELLSSSEDSNNLWKFKDIVDKYNKHREKVKRQDKVNLAILFVDAIFSAVFMLTVSILNLKDSIQGFYLMLCLPVILGGYIIFMNNRVVKNSMKGSEHRVVDIKDVLKNMFYERYKKEKNVEPVDEVILQYLIDKLDKKNLNYKDFLQLDLDKEYYKIAEVYIELKNRKEEFSLLRGHND